MASKLAIVNAAMTLLEQAPVTDVSKDSSDPRGRAADRLYDITKRALLSRHPWGFSIVKAQMSRDSAAPTAHWTYSFAIPTESGGLPSLDGDVLAVYDTSDTDATPLRLATQWVRQGTKVLSNETALWCDFQVEALEGSFPPYFVDVLVRTLASDLAPTVAGVGAANIAALHRQIAFQDRPGMPSLLTVAMRADRRGRPTRILVDNTLVNARRGAW